LTNLTVAFMITNTWSKKKSQ